MVSFLKKFTKDPTKLKENQQLLFLKRLNRLLDHGYSFTDALDVIKWDRQFEQVAEIIRLELTKGKYMDEAFKTAGFHATVVSYIYFVRINGDVLTSMNKCIQMFEHRLNSFEKFKRVIRYPVILFGFFMVLLLFLKFFVLPAFAEMFQSSDASTRSIVISINIINILGTLFICIVVLSTIAIIFWKFIKDNIAIEQQVLIYEKLPVFRHILRLQMSYYFATHMSMFLKTGMSLKNVITHMAGQKEIPLLAYYAERMQSQLQQGFYITHLLEQMTFLESQFTSIFDNNNKIADLQQDLTAYAEFLQEIMESKMMRMITLIQPIFFTALACCIIFIYLTLMWPMFQLINTI